MPSNDGVGPDDHQHRAPPRPQPRQPYPEDAGSLPQSLALGLVLQDRELLADGKVFGRQSGAVTK